MSQPVDRSQCITHNEQVIAINKLSLHLYCRQCLVEGIMPQNVGQLIDDYLKEKQQFLLSINQLKQSSKDLLTQAHEVLITDPNTLEKALRQVVKQSRFAKAQKPKEDQSQKEMITIIEQILTQIEQLEVDYNASLKLYDVNNIADLTNKHEELSCKVEFQSDLLNKIDKEISTFRSDLIQDPELREAEKYQFKQFKNEDDKIEYLREMVHQVYDILKDEKKDDSFTKELKTQLSDDTFPFVSLDTIYRKDSTEKFEKQIKELKSSNQELSTEIEQNKAQFTQFEEQLKEQNQLIKQQGLMIQNLLSHLTSLKGNVNYQVHNNIKILYFNFQGQNVIPQYVEQANKHGIKLDISEINFVEEIEAINDLSGINSILVTNMSQSEQTREKIGSFLNRAAQYGVNIVLTGEVLTDYNCPLGDFQGPFEQGNEDQNCNEWYKCYELHDIFRNNASIQLNNSTLRSQLSLNQVGKVQLVANWSDGEPMIAIRHDLKGLITGITLYSNTTDATQLIINALTLANSQ